MRVFLVDPPHKAWSVLKGWFPNPGLTALAAYLEKDFDVKVLDCTVFYNAWGTLEETIKKEKPEVVGITTVATCFINDTMDAARLIKEISPKTIIVAGGVHPSLLPEETLRNCREIDYIVVGEGEITASEFLGALEKKEKDFSRIKGLAYLEEDKFIYTGDRPLIEDLDSLPMPAFHLFPMDKPFYGMPSEGLESLGFTFSRGCGFRCTFCSETILWRHRWRGYGAQRMADIVQDLVETYGRRTFYFGDNMFNWDRQRTIDFCREIIRRKIKVNFWIQTRADYLYRDQDLLPLLKEAGCYQMLLGIEHHRQKQLDELKKDITVERTLEGMKTLKKHRISLVPTCMIGSWEDTKEEMLNLLKFVKPYVGHFGGVIITPLPGTPFYKEMKALGRIEETDYSKYDYLNAIMPTKTCTRQEINDMRMILHRKCYLDWHFLWKLLFPLNHMMRHSHIYFLKYAVEVFKQEVFGAPEWAQPGYQTFEDYMRGRATGKR